MTPSLWKIGAVISAVVLGGAYVGWQQFIAGRKAEQRQAIESLQESDPVLMLSPKSLGGGMPVQAIDGDSDFLIPADDLTLMPSSKVGIQTEFIEIPGIPVIPDPRIMNGVPEPLSEDEEMLRTLMGSSKSGSVQITDEELQKLLKKGDAIFREGRDDGESPAETEP